MQPSWSLTEPASGSKRAGQGGTDDIAAEASIFTDAALNGDDLRSDSGGTRVTALIASVGIVPVYTRCSVYLVGVPAPYPVTTLISR